MEVCLAAMEVCLSAHRPPQAMEVCLSAHRPPQLMEPTPSPRVPPCPKRACRLETRQRLVSALPWWFGGPSLLLSSLGEGMTYKSYLNETRLLFFLDYVRMRLCVCERERERESLCMCVCVRACVVFICSTPLTPLPTLTPTPFLLRPRMRFCYYM